MELENKNLDGNADLNQKGSDINKVENNAINISE